ncbi:hypothetical protein TSOC_001767 [Tetrabaena socialis]|uniref:Uncharacterized protein n=1 Tax=Tetrabaena socialis TaxID=47790 RepID=A0A2J8AFT3_9CHLO|nr:hypothetical protein TSOC_001767 [Tetrabaena socialis]|eukprot:PNH11352.1 hypothetical protein TSOC_001767 [Tetrabaena socialis]
MAREEREAQQAASQPHATTHAAPAEPGAWTPRHAAIAAVAGTTRFARQVSAPGITTGHFGTVNPRQPDAFGATTSSAVAGMGAASQSGQPSGTSADGESPVAAPVQQRRRRHSSWAQNGSALALPLVGASGGQEALSPDDLYRQFLAIREAVLLRAGGASTTAVAEAEEVAEHAACAPSACSPHPPHPHQPHQHRLGQVAFPAASDTGSAGGGQSGSALTSPTFLAGGAAALWDGVPPSPAAAPTSPQPGGNGGGMVDLQQYFRSPEECSVGGGAGVRPLSPFQGAVGYASGCLDPYANALYGRACGGGGGVAAAPAEAVEGAGVVLQEGSVEMGAGMFEVVGSIPATESLFSLQPSGEQQRLSLLAAWQQQLGGQGAGGKAGEGAGCGEVQGDGSRRESGAARMLVWQGRGADVNATDSGGGQQTQQAPQHASLQLAQQQPQQHLLPGVLGAAPSAGRTALHTAAEAGSFGVAQLLLHSGAFVGVRDGAGRTAFDLARRRGHEAVAGLLKEAAEQRRELVRSCAAESKAESKAAGAGGGAPQAQGPAEKGGAQPSPCGEGRPPGSIAALGGGSGALDQPEAVAAAAGPAGRDAQPTAATAVAVVAGGEQADGPDASQPQVGKGEAARGKAKAGKARRGGLLACFGCAA